MASKKSAAKVPGEQPEEILPGGEVEGEQSAPQADLPSAADIDSNTIARAVLTKDGWICPAPKPIPLSRY